MTVDLDQGTTWIVGLLLAVPTLRAAVGLFKDLRRSPPFPEEAAQKYATREDLKTCRERCDGEIVCLRQTIQDNDAKAEKRAVATHNRVDQVMTCLMETNRKLGTVIGIALGQGRVSRPEVEKEV